MEKVKVKEKKTFSLTINIERLQLGVDVEGDTLENALAEGRGLKVSDLLEFPANVSLNDEEGTRVVGIFQY